MSWFAQKEQQPHRIGVTRVYLKPGIDISFAALAYGLVMLMIGLAAVNTQTNLLFGVLGLMAGVLMIAGILSMVMVRHIGIRRQMPEFLAVGREDTLTYRLSNAKRFWPSFSVSLGELDGCAAFEHQPYAYMLHAAPGATVDVRTRILPHRRGIYHLKRYQVSTSFPLGFIKHAAVAEQQDTIVVFPALAKVNPRVLMMCQSAENTGSPMRPQPGGQDEFYGVKEYRRGEDPRWICWKRSARTGELVVREMTRVSPPRLMLLVDTAADGSLHADFASVERSIAMAASLASYALEQGYPVGLCAWNDGWLQLTPHRGKRQRLDVLTALARLPRNFHHDADELLSAFPALAQTGLTRVLFTHRPIGETRRPRSGLLILLSAPHLDDSLFAFSKEVDFSHCMPGGDEAVVVGPVAPEAIPTART